MNTDKVVQRNTRAHECKHHLVVVFCFTRAGNDGLHRGTITYSIVIGRSLTLLCGDVALNELLKITTEYTILNSHSFCFYDTVNMRNSISDFLDLKL